MRARRPRYGSAKESEMQDVVIWIDIIIISNESNINIG